MEKTGQSPNETDAHCRSRAWVWCPLSKQGVSLMPCILDPRSQIPDSGLGTLTSQPTSRPTGHGEAKLKIVWKWYENDMKMVCFSDRPAVGHPYSGRRDSQLAKMLDPRSQNLDLRSQILDPRFQIWSSEHQLLVSQLTILPTGHRETKLKMGKKWKNEEKIVFVENDMKMGKWRKNGDNRRAHMG